MKKSTDNTAVATDDSRQAKKAVLEAERAKKHKAREAAKAKRLKLLEKRRAKVEANKKKRAEKKAKRLAKLEKQRAKKAAVREKKRLARAKKLEKIAKQKAKAKELKLKAREKVKLEKQQLREKQKELERKQKEKQTKTKTKGAANAGDTIDITVKLLKKYVKQLAKDYAEVDDKRAKRLEKLGFTFTDDTVGFETYAKLKGVDGKKGVTVPVAEPEAVDGGEDTSEIDAAIDDAIDGNTQAIEALAKSLEDDPDAPGTEMPIGDTYTDNVSQADVDDFADEDEDDTIYDSRDESDHDMVSFRHEWNDEFDEDGERNEDW